MKFSPFYRTLERALGLRRTNIEDICPPNDPVARRVLHDYGAMFVGADIVAPPPCCVFTSEDQVATFQGEAGWTSAPFGEDVVELQPAVRSSRHFAGVDCAPALTAALSEALRGTGMPE